MKGQANILVLIMGGAVTIIASALGAWATASNNLSEVKNTVSIVQERESNHYAELSKQLITIETKLDKVLLNKETLR